MERETGIEPATNSLEGCDSTTELLPPSRCALRRASPRRAHRTFRRRARQSSDRSPSRCPATRSTSAAERLARLGERRVVAREGLEPSKPLGRQIYSLLRLTASLPRRFILCVETRCFRALPTLRRWSWRRDLNPRPADYKSAALPTELRQPKQKTNFSTSCAIGATTWEYSS
jgi:hypothetical protein